MALSVENRLDEALKFVNRGLELSPELRENDRCNRARLYQLRGNIHFKMKKYTSALEDYCEAEKIQPLLSRVYLDKALLYKATNRHTDAIDACDISIYMMPYDPDPYHVAMEIFYENDQYDEVISYANRATESEVEHPKISYYFACALRFKERIEDALEILLNLLENENIDEPTKALAFSEIAFIYYDRKDAKQVINYIGCAISRDPKWEFFHWRTLLLEMYDMLKDYKNVILLADEIIHPVEAIPNEWDVKIPYNDLLLVYARRGNAHLQLNNFKKAKYDLIRAINNPDAINAHYPIEQVYCWLGRIYAEHLKDPEIALEYYSKALVAGNRYPPAVLGIAGVLLVLEKNYERALDLYTFLMENTPEDSNLYIQYVIGCAHSMKKMGKHRASRKYYQQALDILLPFVDTINYKSMPFFYLDLADVYAGLGKYYLFFKYRGIAKRLAKTKKINIDIPFGLRPFTLLEGEKIK